MSKLLGPLLRLAYLASRHHWLGLPMSAWFPAGFLVGALVAWRAARPAISIALLALALAWVAMQLAARRMGYIHFRPAPDLTVSAAELPRPDSQIIVWASGRFSVRENTRYLASHPTIYTTPRSREHILMARLGRTRFLLLASSHHEDWGWWYQFFKPAEIRAVRVGTLIHGWRPRPAIHVTVESRDQEDRVELCRTVLACASEDILARVWTDLTHEQRTAQPTPVPAAASRKT